MDFVNDKKEEKLETKKNSNDKKSKGKGYKIFVIALVALVCITSMITIKKYIDKNGLAGIELNSAITNYCNVTRLGKGALSNTLTYTITCGGSVTILDTQYKTDTVDWTSRGSKPGTYTSKTGSIIFKRSLTGKNVYLRVKYKINNTPIVVYSSSASVRLGKTKTFNTTSSPYASATYDINATMNTGVGIVKKYGTFKTEYIFNTKTNYYYKWMTYTGDTADSKISYNGSCLVGSNNKKFGPTLTVSSKYPNRLGKIRFYSSKSECDKDTNGKSEEFLSENPVIYRYRGSVPNSSGLSVNEITNAIGGAGHYCNMTNNTYNDCASVDITNKFACIAYSQVGYLEKKSNSSLNSCTTNSGGSNYQKYGNNGGAWCAAFVDWVAKKAGINFESYGVKGVNSTSSYKSWAQESSRWYTWNSETSPTNIHEGDILIFDGHIGIAYKRNGVLWLIDGNNSNRVEDHSYTEYERDEGSSSTAVPLGYISLKDIAYEK